MKGKYTVIISNNRLRYELVLERQVTIIKGNSGTGKSTLVNWVSTLVLEDRDTGYHCNMRDKLAVIQNRSKFAEEFKENHGKIYFIDEMVNLVFTKEFAEAVQGSDNYYVIVTRTGKGVGYLTYSIDSVYELGSEKVGKVTVNKLYQRYISGVDRIKPDLVITEDSNSGYQMISNIFDCEVISAKGKDNVFNVLSENKSLYSKIYIIVDGASFGNCIERVYNELNDSIFLYTPESFEWMLLSVSLINRFVKGSELSKTYDYCDTRKYISWERYYTKLLKDISLGNLHIQYAKRKLPKMFLSDSVVKEIRNMLSDIIW